MRPQGSEEKDSRHAEQMQNLEQTSLGTGWITSY